MHTTKTQTPPHSGYSPRPYDFFLVGIGSSNGGLEPLKTILSSLPTDISAAIIVIHHGPFDAPDQLVQILRDIAVLPVIDMHDQQTIRPGHIYVAPAGALVRLRDHVLSIEKDSSVRRSSRVIDACFRSLAYEGREKSIGVILSGAGYDGLEGAIALERHGGLVIAQDPATAKFPMMPVATIANDDPSFILEPEEIGELIASQLGK